MNRTTPKLGRKVFFLRPFTHALVRVVGVCVMACLLRGIAEGQEALLYSNARPGPPTPLGLVLGNGQLAGMRFQLSSCAIIDGIGGNIQVSSTIGDRRIFGALVRLTNFNDYPDSSNLSTPDVLAIAEFRASSDFMDVAKPIGPLTVEPGVYALVLGSGLFGATGEGSMSLNNPNFAHSSTFFSTFDNIWSEYGAAGGLRFAVYGALVPDKTPPQIVRIVATPNALWPPNHRMIPVSVIVDAVDNCDPLPVVRITRVMSNEPQNPFAADWEITGPQSVNLRAERLGKGEGRIYTIVVQCEDVSGNVSFGSVDVTVSHDNKGHLVRKSLPAAEAVGLLISR